jgi:hypothetical protein
MNKYISYTMVALVATIAVSIAATPDKATMEAKEKSAWQAFKDKNADAFKKLVDKDVRCVTRIASPICRMNWRLCKSGT